MNERKAAYDGMGKSKEELEEEKKAEKEKDEDTQRIEKIALEIELDTRRVFNLKTKELDMRRLRATDMKDKLSLAKDLLKICFFVKVKVRLS